MSILQRCTLGALLVVVALASTGCIGIRSNKRTFRSLPAEGLSEVELLQKYGSPDYSKEIGDETVYVFRLVDEIYIVLLGLSTSVDIVVTCSDGEVVAAKEVELGDNFSVFQPNTWQVTH